jgi:hypothetical protein
MCWWNGAAEGWMAPLQRPLPAPGCDGAAVALVRQADDGHIIGYDIPGMAYWVLSAQEEVGRVDLDNHGRFPATASHAHQHGYLERPVVDEWLSVLGQVMERQWPGIALPKPKAKVVVSTTSTAPVATPLAVLDSCSAQWLVMCSSVAAR